MSRSKWKGPFLNIKEKTSQHKNKNSETIDKNSFIVPKFINKTFKLHNGKIYSEIEISKEMIGHKFGEFVFTRKKFLFKKKKSKK
jgi:ribosomal protein S19